MRASRRPCALRPRSRRASAGALVAHVRFCGARSAHLTLSKVRALALDCAEGFLAIHFSGSFHMAILIGRNHGAPCKSATHISHKCSHEGSFVNSVFIISAMKERSGLEGRRHEAEAVTAGDADGGKRDAADPATGGIPTEPGDGRPRRIRTRRPAGIRRSRRCAALPATYWLSADRMCWAGNAAAVSRARLGRRDDWRWTRPRRQSGDCRAGRGRSQTPSATGG